VKNVIWPRPNTRDSRRKAARHLSLSEPLGEAGSGRQMELGDTLADRQPDPRECALTAEARQRALAMLRYVHPSDRRLAELAWIDGLGCRGAGARLGISRTRAQQRLERARSRLRKALLKAGQV
jgi:RNA polymerase sigma factor (sigma-70 family)